MDEVIEKDKGFRKNFIWNIIGTTFNAFNSLFFMIIITRVNGLENAGIFTLAFSTACILYIIGIYAGRIYQVTEASKEITDKDYIANRIISCIIMIVIVIFFVIINQYDVYKSSIFIILTMYKALEAFSDVLYGIMQKNELLEKAGKSTFMKAIISIIVFVIIDLSTKNLIISCLSIIVIFIAVILLYDIRKTKILIEKENKVKCKNILSIFKNGFFTFAISFLGLYITNAPKYAIDSVLTEEIQAIFGIIIMPATVMSLLAQFLIHPYLNTIFKLYQTNKYKELEKVTYKIILVIFLFGTLSIIAGYLFGTQVLGIIYGINLENYKIALTAILVGATFYTMAGIISPILVTMRYTKIQFVIYSIISIIELILCNILVKLFEFKGAIISYTVVMIIYFVTFYIVSMTIISNKKRSYIKK